MLNRIKISVPNGILNCIFQISIVIIYVLYIYILEAVPYSINQMRFLCVYVEFICIYVCMLNTYVFMYVCELSIYVCMG